MNSSQKKRKAIAYQGMPGAFSHLACQRYHPEFTPYARGSFAACFEMVRRDEAALAMIPVENSAAGRVSDIYHLLPEGGLKIAAEHYLPVHHNLLALPGTQLSDIKTAYSHPMALSQVRHYLHSCDIAPRTDLDTAGAAARLAERKEAGACAISSELAAEIYGLEILARNIEDESNNTTRFLTLSLDPKTAKNDGTPVVTSFVFKVRNVPSALYKAMGGFATNGLNITKLESYMVGGSFTATQFYADVEGHPENPAMQLAFEELAFFTERVEVLGTYEADAIRGLG